MHFPYDPGDIFVVDGLAWFHDGEDFAMHGVDPHSGEVKRTISTEKALDEGHHHRCYRNKATTEYFVTARRGVEFIGPEEGGMLASGYEGPGRLWKVEESRGMRSGKRAGRSSVAKSRVTTGSNRT